MKATLNKEQAISLLPSGDRIHTFRCGSGILIGADWDRAEILKAIETSELQLAGKMAAGMDHGLCVGTLFVETNPVALKAIEKQFSKP